MPIGAGIRGRLQHLLANALIIAILASALPNPALTETEDELNSLADQIIQSLDRGNFPEAAALATRLTGLAERTYGPDHPDTFASLGYLAEIHRMQGLYSEAEPLYRRVLEGRERVLGKEHKDTLSSVGELGELLFDQGRYGEAEPLLRRVVETRERVLGKEHPDTLNSVNILALTYKTQGRHNEAEPLYLRAFETQQRILGADHADTLISVNNLATLYQAQGRYSEAEPLYQRAVKGLERAIGAEHRDTLFSLSHLAGLYNELGRYNEAEPIFAHVLEVRERTLGKENPDTLISVNNLAVLYATQGRYDEAEPLHKRALDGFQRVLGKEHPNTLGSLSALAQLSNDQGHYSEAERLYRRALEAQTRVLGELHPDTLSILHNLSSLYWRQGRDREAELLMKRSLAAQESVLGKEHPATLANLNDLGLLYKGQGRHSEVEPLYRRVLEAYERTLGVDHPATLISASNLAALYTDQGRFSEAEPLYKRALEAFERVLGREHPNTLSNLSSLANFYVTQGRYSDAEQLYHRVAETRGRLLGERHPDVAIAFNNLAALHFAQSDWGRAVEFWRRSTGSIVQRVVLDTGGALTGKKKSEAEQLSFQFSMLVKALSRLADENSAADAALTREMFQTAQWALASEAGQSLAQMAARSARNDSALATLVRERQDQAAEWQKRDLLRNHTLSQTPEKRNAKADEENLARLIAIDVRIAEIDQRLQVEFPDYAALASAQPLSVEDVQAQLGANEVLVLFLDTDGWKTTPRESFIWVVTKTDARWVRTDLGTQDLRSEVRALRCGLDIAEWAGSHCARLLGQSYTRADQRAGKLLPFDHARAHALYKELFGRVEDLIKEKHLLLVPSGPLTQLPFQVLVTAPPAGGDPRSIRWLARDHALTVLPAVSSIKALRRVDRGSGAERPMIGFGNPLLDGVEEDAEYASLARTKQSCGDTAPQQQMVALRKIRSAAAPVKAYGGLANLSHLRVQAPLPETADELCAVARSVHSNESDMHLGTRATEREVKALSERGELAKYRIVHFATHGAMTGELDGTSEPGLILTPPQEASADDDGYLSGSEVAALKLDADWVILSACNTAAGDASNAEALSGLARAFIYAQTRALLVSHWAVDSQATVKLITATLGEIGRNPGIGRAESLRRAMLELIDKGDTTEAHPAYWAPFIVVGEGTR